VFSDVFGDIKKIYSDPFRKIPLPVLCRFLRFISYQLVKIAILVALKARINTSVHKYLLASGSLKELSQPMNHQNDVKKFPAEGHH
jgi:hypothetical protein